MLEVQVQNQIIDFFSFLEDFYIASKSCLKSCQNHAISINKIIRRCRNIKEVQFKDTSLAKFRGLQRKLLSIFHQQINLDIVEIQHQFSKIEELFEKLCHKNQTLHESCRTIDLSLTTPLVRGTSLQPPLHQILLFASESITFGSQVVAQIETSLSILSFKQLDTANFHDNFKFPSRWNQRILEILAYTSFCSKNEI